MGSAPAEAGALQCMAAEPLPAVAATPVGDSGTPVDGAHDEGSSRGEDASTCSALLICPGTGPPGWPHQFARATTGPIADDCPPASRSARGYGGGGIRARLRKRVIRGVVGDTGAGP